MSEVSGIRLVNSVNEDAFEDKIQKVVASMQNSGVKIGPLTIKPASI